MAAATLSQELARQADRLGPRPALRWYHLGLYRDLSWSQFHEQAWHGAAGLVDLGVSAGDRVAILSENRVEWLITDHAIHAAGAINVPLHAPLSAEQVAWQLNDSEACGVFVSTIEQYAKIAAIRPAVPSLRFVVILGARQEAAISWEGFLQRGRVANQAGEVARRVTAHTGDDLASIIYTSGTTGEPKGVMLTHANLLSNARAFAQLLRITADSVFLNWLPFSHIYARTVDAYGSLVTGVPLALARSVDTLVADLGMVQPSNMSSVPRFYEKIAAAMPPGEAARAWLRNIFGPRMDWLGSGGAPLPLAIAERFRDAGILLLQGYGLSESSPVITYNHPDAYHVASVGKPIPGVEVRIADDGEILTQGPHVMKGYWRNPHATADAIRDGWLHTGDLGRFDNAGFLHITGRKKELIVLSNGKNIAPVAIEGLLLADPCIDQVVVMGEGRPCLVALVVPNLGNVQRQLGLQDAPPTNDARVRDHLWGIARTRLAGLAGWEQVKKIAVIGTPFSVEREELTVSLKLRRNVIAEHYADVVDRLYREY